MLQEAQQEQNKKIQELIRENKSLNESLHELQQMMLKSHERELQKLQARLTYIAQNTGLGHLLFINNHVDYVNTEFIKYFHIDDNNLINWTLETFIELLDELPDKERIKNFIFANDGIKYFETNLSNLDVNGKVQVLRICLNKHDQENNTLLITVFDVTCEEIALQSLEKSSKNNEATLKSINEGVITTDFCGLITRINSIACQLLDVNDKKVINQPITEVLSVYHSRSGRKLPDPVMEAIKSKYNKSYERFTLLKNKSGGIFHVQLKASPILDANQMLLGAIMVFSDISKQYKLEKALRESEARLKARLDLILSPDADNLKVKISDIFSVSDLQNFQDAFAQANLLFSVIVDLNGFNITQPSNPLNISPEINIKTNHCQHVSSTVQASGDDKKTTNIQVCPNCKSLIATAPIIVGGKHIASWIISQPTDGSIEESKPNLKRFQDISKLLSLLATEISEKAYNNFQLAREAEANKKTEEELRNNDHYLKAILNTTPGLLFIVNREGYYRNIFTAQPQLLKYPKDQIVGKNMAEFFDPDFYKKSMHRIALAIDTGELQHMDYQMEINGQAHYFVAEITRIESQNEINALIVAYDVTRTKNQTKEIQKSEAQKTAIINNLPHRAWIKDREGRYLMVNEQFKRASKPENNKIIGLTSSEIKDDFTIRYKHIEETVIKNGIQHQYEESTAINNKTRWFETFIAPVFDDDHQVIGTTGISRDITERKNFENRLMLSEANLNALFESSENAYFLVDQQAKIIKFNQNAGEFIYQANKKVISEGDYLPEFLPKQLSRDFANNIARAMSNERVFSEQLITLRNGSNLWFELRFMPSYDMLGELFGVSISLLDISTRKSAEKAIIESEERYRLLVDTSPDSIILCNIRGIIEYVSDKALHLFGISSRADFNGKFIGRFIDQKQRKELKPLLDILLKQDKLEQKEIQLLNANKTVFTGEVSLSLVKNFDNEGTGFIAVVRDISQRKKIEEELISAKEKAEESDRLKSAFLANMSHEIRTPMNGILGFASLLEDKELEEDLREEYVSIINSNSKSLLNIIDDIIDVAKIEAGQLSLKQHPCNLNELCEEVFAFYQETLLIKKSNIELRVNVPDEDLAVVTLTDPTRVRQILTNLLNNALKFTEKGYVEFGYNKKGDKVVFYVKDTGIGMRKEDSLVIFDRFRQLEESYTRKYGGTGLGLTICKNLVELMNGELWVETELNNGSVFTFSIPYSPDEDFEEVKERNRQIKMNEQMSVYNWEGKRILIAEDEEINYFYIKEILKRTNAELIHVTNGQQALDYISENNHIDLVLMDIKMPVMNGLEATTKIKSIKEYIPVIALTAYAMGEDKFKCLEAGCDDYLSKPVKKDDLLQLISSHMAIS